MSERPFRVEKGTKINGGRQLVYVASCKDRSESEETRGLDIGSLPVTCIDKLELYIFLIECQKRRLGPRRVVKEKILHRGGMLVNLFDLEILGSV